MKRLQRLGNLLGSEAVLLVGFGAAIGLTFFILTGGWTGFLR